MPASKVLPDFVVHRGVLAESICESLVEGRTKRSGYRRSAGRTLERRVDISQVSYPHNKALFDEIATVARRNNVWRLTLGPIYDDMRVQRYRVNDFTETHSDFDYPQGDYAKLTVVIPLVEPTSWEGGELQVGNMRRSPRLLLGDAVIFPSFVQHRVTRVSKGTRVSLSAWMSGPAPR